MHWTLLHIHCWACLNLEPVLPFPLAKGSFEPTGGAVTQIGHIFSSPCINTMEFCGCSEAQSALCPQLAVPASVSLLVGVLVALPTVFLWQGMKRKAVSEYQAHDDSSENSECSFPFKYAYGVNAWKHWVKSRHLEEELPELEELKSSKYFQKSGVQLLTCLGKLPYLCDSQLEFLTEFFSRP